MTLNDLLTAMYQDLGYQTTPASAVTTRITRYLNEGVRTILTLPGMFRLQDSDPPLTFSSVASTQRSTLPEVVAQIRSITERTNNQRLRMMTLDGYRRLDPNPTQTSGTPEYWIPIGKVSVAVQPSAASQMFVSSTAAGDTTQTAYIEGVRTGGYQGTASVVLTGTTAVAVGALTDFIEITDFYLSATCTGTVTLNQGSGGTELARVTIGSLRPRYYGFYLWPTPSVAVTYYVDYRRETIDLANTTDEPALPTDFHPMLVVYGRMREYELKDDARLPIAQAQWTSWVQRLRDFVLYPPDARFVAGPIHDRGSNLGAWYPAGRW